MTGASITPAEHRAIQASAMSEAQLQAAILGAARRAGFLAYHTHDSRRSAAGYPDLHLVHPQRGISLLRELKTEKGRLTPDQQQWLHALTAAGQDAGVWRPMDWLDGTVDAVLEGRAR
jgi:hypothetical protein